MENYTLYFWTDFFISKAVGRSEYLYDSFGNYQTNSGWTEVSATINNSCRSRSTYYLGHVACHRHCYNVNKVRGFKFHIQRTPAHLQPKRTDSNTNHSLPVVIRPKTNLSPFHCLDCLPACVEENYYGHSLFCQRGEQEVSLTPCEGCMMITKLFGHSYYT